MFFSAPLEFVLHKQAHTTNKSSLLSSIKFEYSNYLCLAVFLFSAL